jgi:predicted nucleic acid-binding protein
LRRFVVDASVALKWFFQSTPDEDHLDKALALLSASRSLAIQFVQPPHFIAEVAAVLARKKPEEAEADLRDLLALDLTVVDDSALYQRASDLSIRLQHHLFDTLYHALALHTPDAILITADQRYSLLI